jgi:hypothetical protein
LVFSTASSTQEREFKQAEITTQSAMGDAAEVNIDKQLFHARLGNLVAAWKDPKKNDVFGGVSSIVVILGKTEEGPYSKSLSLHV